MPKFIQCPICHEQHLIDKYGWVMSCIGYFDVNSFRFETIEYMEGRGEHYRLFKKRKK